MDLFESLAHNTTLLSIYLCVCHHFLRIDKAPPSQVPIFTDERNDNSNHNGTWKGNDYQSNFTTRERFQHNF